MSFSICDFSALTLKWRSEYSIDTWNDQTKKKQQWWLHLILFTGCCCHWLLDDMCLYFGNLPQTTNKTINNIQGSWNCHTRYEHFSIPENKKMQRMMYNVTNSHFVFIWVRQIGLIFTLAYLPLNLKYELKWMIYFLVQFEISRVWNSHLKRTLCAWVRKNKPFTLLILCKFEHVLKWSHLY